MTGIQVPRLVIGGTTSGVGKTTIAVGVMAALVRRGLNVQPYKVGPDYIDPSYHAVAAGRSSRNLDAWMLSEATVLELFARSSEGADIALIEGVMGLFDGLSGLDEAGSTAQMAKVLRAPVLLVLDVSRTARSAAAMALGYARLDPGVRLAGIILNRVAGPRHRDWTKEAVEGLAGLPVLGALPEVPDLALPERHLGLVPATERQPLDAFLERLVPIIEGHLDLDRLIALAAQAEPVPLASASLFKIDVPTRPVRIALAQDEAFSFYYADGLDLLTAAGADLVRFSPIHDASLPAGAQGLYIGGGFPELFGDQLEANGRMRREILESARDGMPIYAECGGLMYLTEAIVDFDGTSFPMVGAVPGRAVMERGRLRIGYVEVEPLGENILAGPGTRLRGHEFHCARWDGAGSASPAYSIVNLDGRPEGYQCGNLLATFIHLHLATDASLAGRFVASCAQYPKQ
jgi:cobyrinic acid a,c-diamide synthase